MGRGICCREGTDMCANPKKATYLWSSDDVDETVLKSRLLWELTPDLISPGVVLEANVCNGAFWNGTSALQREQTWLKICDLKAQYVFF
jgi:hypothetical protein